MIGNGPEIVVRFPERAKYCSLVGSVTIGPGVHPALYFQAPGVKRRRSEPNGSPDLLMRLRMIGAVTSPRHFTLFLTQAQYLFYLNIIRYVYIYHRSLPRP